MHGRVCVCIPGFHLPDANGSHPLRLHNQKVSVTIAMAPLVQSHIHLRTTDLENVILETPEPVNFWLSEAGMQLYSDGCVYASCLKVCESDQKSASLRLVITSVVINFPKHCTRMSHSYLNSSATADWFCSPIVSNFM